MSTIIQRVLTLDIITKLLCEITNMPNAYKTPIKFKREKIYSSDINMKKYSRKVDYLRIR
ncbi:hypothetical protein GKD10_03130 [Paeniclostridium sordellii]|nr:hypothetical protein [Paeniclostridium sordellii]